MQLAELEYMCTECGYKFYINKNRKPKECLYCKVTFDWGSKPSNIKQRGKRYEGNYFIINNVILSHCR